MKYLNVNLTEVVMSYEKSALKLEECQFGLNESLHSSSPYKNRYIPPPRTWKKANIRLEKWNGHHQLEKNLRKKIEEKNPET